MDCPACNAPNPEGTTTCVECGRPLPTAPQPYTQGIVKNSDTAIASLICGILGWTVLPILGAILALILGYTAKNEIQQSDGALVGDGMATLGLALGYAHLGLAALGIIVLVLLTILGIAIPLAFMSCGLCALVTA